MKLLVLATVIVAVCGTSFAQQGTGDRCHDSAQSQAELNTCASEQAKQADAELQIAYARLMKAASGDPTAQAKFRAMENSWLRFRTAYLNASYPAPDKQLAYGTVFPMEFDELATMMTREQVGRLGKLLENYDVGAALNARHK